MKKSAFKGILKYIKQMNENYKHGKRLGKLSAMVKLDKQIRADLPLSHVKTYEKMKVKLARKVLKSKVDVGEEFLVKKNLFISRKQVRDVVKQYKRKSEVMKGFKK